MARPKTAAADRDRPRQHRAAEALRRLREVDRLARDRLDDRAVAVDALDGVARLQRGDGRAMRRGGVDGPVDQIRADKRPRRVVDEHDVGPLADRVEGVGDGILAALAANGGPQLGRDAAGHLAERHRRGRPLRQDQDDFVDARVGVKRGQTVLQHRPAANVEQLLRRGPAEAAASSSGGDDRGDVHWINRDYRPMRFPNPLSLILADPESRLAGPRKPDPGSALERW